MSGMLYLASQSPRRRELLAQIGLTPVLVAATVDESVQPGEAPVAYVERLARAKAQAGWQRLCEAGPDSGPLVEPVAAPVLGADTAVSIDGDILGKPVDTTDAVAMLRRLSGREHLVATGVAVCWRDMLQSCVAITRVRFAPLSDEQIARYCATREPFDKAGGYAIQGRAAVFVAALQGSYSGVVGLPLFETAQLLRRVGIEC